MFYDDSGTYTFSEESSGNLYSDAGVTDNRGVLWNDLKYAINVNVILNAIEKKYNLTFSNDFFLASNTFNKLYLWMHRKSGYFETSVEGTVIYNQLVDTITPTVISDQPISSYSYNHTFSSDSITITDNAGKRFQHTIDIETSSSNLYNLDVLLDGEIIKSFNNLQGNEIVSYKTSIRDGVITFNLSSESGITFTKFDIDTIIYTGIKSLGSNGNITLATVSLSSDVVIVDVSPKFNPQEQLPEMKVMDFLTGFFKMFNLTAYYDGSELVVKPLNDYYDEGNEIDITKYVDVSSSKVNVALPYNEVEFKFEGEGTFLTSKHRQLFNRQFGGLKYNGDSSDNWVGSKYTVEAPFERVIFEDLVSSSGFSSVKYGYIVNENQEPYIGKPIIFFARHKEDTTDIKFRDNETSNSDIDDYWIPSNSEAMFTASKTLFFGAENDIGGITLENSLFANYYEDYISDVFNEKRRITKIKAFLPLKVLLTYTLADVFIINGKKYKINSITSNLQTGESDLELLNEV